MYEKVYFDLAAGLILFTIIIALQLRRMTKGQVNKIFLMLVYFCLATSFVDILRFFTDGNTSIPNQIKIFIIVIYYVLRSGSFASYCFYVVSITDMWHKANTRLQKYIMPIPAFVTLLLGLSAYFSDYAFFFDQNGYFVSGNGIWIFYLCNELYGMYSVVSIFVYRRYLGNRKAAALLSTVVASLLAYLFNQAYPQFHMDMIFYSAGILFVMIVVQNPEVRLDYQSGLIRHATYFWEISRGFESEKPMTVIMIDIKNFKELSHMLSYNKTSDFIRYLGTRMQIISEKMKLNAELYYIKDGKFRAEFTTTSPEITQKTAEAYNNLFNSQVELEDISLELNSIICIVKCPENFNDIDSFRDFDSSLSQYETDSQIVFASEVLSNDEYNVVRHMDSIIEKALMENGLEVYYQPILNAKTGKFDTAEALLRLYDDRYGFIYPEIFIPAAEKNGAIHRMGEFVLDEVCKFISSDEFGELNLDYISINLSALQCLKKELPDKVFDVINKYGISPQTICFEISESPATDTQKIFFENIEKMGKKGILFAFDNFGAGYSNVTTVVNNLLTVIKFDKTFVKNMSNKRFAAILVNYVEMSKDLGKITVIEGVETKEEAELFISLGCHGIQGFYYSHALPKDEYVSFLKEHI